MVWHPIRFTPKWLKRQRISFNTIPHQHIPFLYQFADLLISLPTGYDNGYMIDNTRNKMRPYHKNVNVALNSPGTAVASPVGPAIGCSDATRCDIKWEIDLANDTCPCAFNISCCTNGVTLSFWWYWNLSSIDYYRHFLDVGGIYVFYKPSGGNHELRYRVYGPSDKQWFNIIPVPNVSWLHVGITLQSTRMTLYLDGRFHSSRGSIDLDSGWFPGATSLTPHIWLKPATGNYSLGKMYLWENGQSALYIWRQHYEQLGVK